MPLFTCDISSTPFNIHESYSTPSGGITIDGETLADILLENDADIDELLLLDIDGDLDALFDADILEDIDKDILALGLWLKLIDADKL